MSGFRWCFLVAVVAVLVTSMAGVASAEERSNGDWSQLDLEAATVDANQARIDRSNRAMTVLLSWSVANIGVGTAGYFMSDGPTRYFHQMNAAWNGVNALIAGVGLWNGRRDEASQYSPMETVEADYRLQKVLLFNSGLNLAYMAAGAYLWERGLRRDDERLQGYGPSLLLQGGFLLAFDATFFWLQNRAARDYRQNLSLYWDDGPRAAVQVRF